jgi:hypothetical protein
MSKVTTSAPKETGAKVSVIGKIVALMVALGQVFTAKYDKVELLLSIGVDSPEFVSIENKVTKDGREYFVLNFADPKNAKVKGSLPISGDESAEKFEIWLAECNTDFQTTAGQTVTKGTQKVRCYSVDEE